MKSVLARCAVLLAAAMLTACAHAPWGRGEHSPAPASPLQDEQRWLQSLFKGTPVAIADAADGSLLVEVPLQHSFDAGSSSVKPALAAVLDRVAASLQRKVTVRLRLAAPVDATADAKEQRALAYARMRAMRDHLVARGVRAFRVTDMTVTKRNAVQMRLLPAPPPVARLAAQDQTLAAEAEAGTDNRPLNSGS